tara:strand:- start:1706 stop:2320 length:615 start_codon:yes stop_codon:yes gene_type:complete
MSNYAPAPTPPTLFGMDMAEVGQIGMVGQIFGGLSASLGAYFQAKSSQLELRAKSSTLDYQSKMAGINARMSEQQAQQIMKAGQFAQMTQTMKAGQNLASYKTSSNARGIVAGEGSAQEVVASANLMKDLDKMTLNSNTVRAAEAERMKKVGFQNQSTLLGVSAANAMSSAGTISPFSAVSTSLLGSSTSVMNSWYNKNRPYAG